MGNQSNTSDITLFLEHAKRLISIDYKGPKLDLDPNKPGDIWEFKKQIDGKPFYIKVKITKENEEDILKCLGFHEDDFA